MKYEKECKICVICGKEFNFWHSRAKTCGKECSKIYEKYLKKLYEINNPEKVKASMRRSYYKNRKPIIKKCKICNLKFIAKGCSFTCSKKCSNINRLNNSNINSRIWVKRHPEKRKEMCRKYYKKNAEILNKKSSEWAKNNPKKVYASVNKWRKNDNNRKKRNAQALAQHNIKIPEDRTCELCKTSNNERIERHHIDYNKPLSVIFLCPKCHKKVHMENINLEVCNEKGVQTN